MRIFFIKNHRKKIHITIITVIIKYMQKNKYDVWINI